MNKLNVPGLNLELTVLSGQTFSWIRKDEWFFGIFRNSVIKTKQIGKEIYWQTYPKKDNHQLVKEYFRLDQEYDEILNEISVDEHIKSSIEKYYGLRNLNQDFEQTLFSFILASNKNIKAIRRSIDIFRQMGGKEIEVDGEKIHLFPSLEFFRGSSEAELQKTGVGYRAKYLKAAADFLSTTTKEVLTREDILQIRGVGPKIADCVASFSLNQTDITPIDRWSERVIKDLYKHDIGKEYEDHSDWFREKFGKHTALAGQFLFEYVRSFNAEDYS